MHTPFRIPSPSYVAFSGGRTSGYMLRRILDAFGGTLPEGIEVIFCNTGLEHPATLRFVENVAMNWGVAIVWLEYRKSDLFEVVNYGSASRNGEPFSQLLETLPVLPNVRMRICTSQLKIRTAMRYMKTKHEEWFRAIGLRADEPRRVGRMRSDYVCETPLMPLADAGVDRAEVNRFWRESDFDLELPYESNIFGNCVGCFLKSTGRTNLIMKEMPEHFDWWIGAEKSFESKVKDWTGARFRIDRPSYADLMSASKDELLFNFEDDDIQECACTE